ncbi:MAG TPA: hypothetical protein VK968_17620 [Roseimicrobium sp.]|nr:hypothetical protein [Roseimicrobium sp.]
MNIIFWVSVAAAILLLAIIAIPNFVKARTTACRNACVANVKQLDGAVQQWALEQKKKNTDSPVFSEVLVFMKGGQIPGCPGGGTYILGATVADMPYCSKGTNH